MKTEQLEKYIFNARLNRTPDEHIRQELVVGGWDPVAIDTALKTATTNIEKTQQSVDASLELKESGFFPGFLPIFVTLLILFNVISYWGLITAAPNTIPVSNLELIGGVIMCLLATLILSGIYAGFKKIRQSPKALLSPFFISFIVLLVVFNLITFSGQLRGLENVEPVSGLEIVGGIIVSLIGAFIFSLIWKGIRKIIKKFKK